eukprot:13392121-Alexandrium_andersonii.AAC.1
MQGKWAPELAMGMLASRFDQLWGIGLGEFLCKDSGVGDLTEAQFKSLIDDLEAGRAHMHLILKTKLDHWQRLPWFLAGLASLEEQDARLCGTQALAMFDGDPRSQSHHKITFERLRVGSDFRAQL